MGQLKKGLNGRLLKTTFINPNISLNLFRKYGRINGKFEIQIKLPRYLLRIINRHENVEMALSDYEEMLEKIGDGTPEEISEFKGTFFV